MNRRTLKKHCARAMRRLIAEHGFRADQFLPADGGEAVVAPARMERRFVCREFLEPGPLPGTMLLWRRTSYETDEWELMLPTEMLEDIELAAGADWSAIAAEAFAPHAATCEEPS